MTPRPLRAGFWVIGAGGTCNGAGINWGVAEVATKPSYLEDQIKVWIYEVPTCLGEMMGESHLIESPWIQVSLLAMHSLVKGG